MPGQNDPSNPIDSPADVATEPGGKPTIDFRAEFDDYLPYAAAIPASEVRICRSNTDVMAVNVRIGVNSISEPEILDRIRRELPEVDIAELLDLPRLGETVARAARMVFPAPKPHNLEASEKRAAQLRKLLLGQIGILVESGLVKREELDALRKGRGKVNAANDLIDAAALFTQYGEQLEGKHPITPEQIKEAQTLGNLLREAVAPSAAIKPKSKARRQAAENRDRLWTLLSQRHQTLRRVAVWMWPKEADERVPPLGSRVHRRKNAGTKDLKQANTPVPPANEKGEEKPS
jgi:hypothetical protein